MVRILVGVCFVSSLSITSTAAAETHVHLIDTLVGQVQAMQSVAAPTNKHESAKRIREFLASPFTVDPPSVDEIQRALDDLDSDSTPAPGRQDFSSSISIPKPGFSIDNADALQKGIAQFMINRAKEEATIAVMLRLKTDLAPDLLQALFPRAYAVSLGIDAESATQVVGTVRAAFTDDLRRVPDRLLKNEAVIRSIVTGLNGSLTDPKIQELLRLRPALYALAQLLRDEIHGVNPAAALAELADSTQDFGAISPNMRLSFVTVGRLAGEYAAQPEDATDVFRNPQKSLALLGLMRRELATEFSSKPEYQAALTQWSTRAQSAGGVIKRTSDLLSALQSVVDSADRTDQRGALITITRILDRTSDVIEQAEAFAPDSADLTRFADESRAISSLLSKIESHSFEDAIASFAFAVQDLTGHGLPSAPLRILAFAGQLSDATTSDEVAAAIEAVAEPATSYRMKRIAPSNTHPKWAAVNGYVGAGGGREQLLGQGKDGVGFGYGVTIPVGVEFGAAVKNGFYLGVFAPLIDVGTAASFRHGGTISKDTPNQTLRQIVAPGLYAVFGFTVDMPISVGVGVQYLPALRTATSGNNPLDAVRIGAFAAIDVPIIRIR